MRFLTLLKAVVIVGICCCLAAAHPLKMCVCHAKYHSDKQQLSLKFNFFQDDLEAALEKKFNRDLDLTSPTADQDKVLDAFLKSNFSIKINGTPSTLQYLSAKYEDPILRVEWVVNGLAPADQYQVEVYNQLLLDDYAGQYNLIRFDFFGDGNLETMRFEREERTLSKWIKKG
jgi:hypothetical protein